MNELQLLSSRQIRKNNKAWLKRLQRSYKVALLIWEGMNYYDFYGDEEMAKKMGMTFEQFECWQKNVVNSLSQYCKIRQERIFELMYSGKLL